MMKRLAILGSAAFAIGLTSASNADEVKMRAASFLPKGSIIAAPFHRWVDEVNKKCEGKVHIIVVGPEAIGSLEQWNAVRTGVVDMHYGPANYYKGQMIEAEATLVARKAPAEQRANGAWEMLNELHNEKMNVQYLTYLFHGVNMFLWLRRPAPDNNFTGLRVRSVPIYDDFFRSMGIHTARMAPGDVYTALERGTVDGYGWPSWGIADFGWHRHTQVRYGPGFFNASVNILVNLDKWKSLSDDQRQCLTEMTVWLEGEWPKWRDETTKEEEAKLKEAGIRYVDMGQGFADKAENLYWDQLEKANPEFIGKLRPLLAD